MAEHVGFAAGRGVSLCFFYPPSQLRVDLKTLKLNKPKPSLDISLSDCSQVFVSDFIRLPWGISTGAHNLVKGSFGFRLFLFLKIWFLENFFFFRLQAAFMTERLPGKFKGSERRSLSWVQTFGACLYKLAAVENKPNKQYFRGSAISLALGF